MNRPELWPGADVQWVAARTAVPQMGGGEREIHRGDRAVVIDPGSCNASGVVPLQADPGARPPGSVVVELPDGVRAAVDPAGLEVLLPDLPFRPEADGSVARWLIDELRAGHARHPGQVAAEVPASFDAVACVLHPWQYRESTGRHTSATWCEVARRGGYATLGELGRAARDRDGRERLDRLGYTDREGRVDAATARALIECLSGETSGRPPHDVHLAVWTGFGDIPPAQFPGAARICVPGRDYVVLSGPLDELASSISITTVDEPRSALTGLCWPATREWVTATDPELAWTFVAGSDGLIERLLRHADLEAFRTTFSAAADWLSAER